jgi:hypothetical protein
MGLAALLHFHFLFGESFSDFIGDPKGFVF